MPVASKEDEDEDEEEEERHRGRGSKPRDVQGKGFFWHLYPLNLPNTSGWR